MVAVQRGTAADSWCFCRTEAAGCKYSSCGCMHSAHLCGLAVDSWVLWCALAGGLYLVVCRFQRPRVLRCAVPCAAGPEPRADLQDLPDLHQGAEQQVRHDATLQVDMLLKHTPTPAGLCSSMPSSQWPVCRHHHSMCCDGAGSVENACAVLLLCFCCACAELVLMLLCCCVAAAGWWS